MLSFLFMIIKCTPELKCFECRYHFFSIELFRIEPGTVFSLGILAISNLDNIVPIRHYSENTKKMYRPNSSPGGSIRELNPEVLYLGRLRRKDPVRLNTFWNIKFVSTSLQMDAMCTQSMTSWMDENARLIVDICNMNLRYVRYHMGTFSFILVDTFAHWQGVKNKRGFVVKKRSFWRAREVDW